MASFENYSGKRKKSIKKERREALNIGSGVLLPYASSNMAPNQKKHFQEEEQRDLQKIKITISIFLGAIYAKLRKFLCFAMFPSFFTYVAVRLKSNAKAFFYNIISNADV